MRQANILFFGGGNMCRALLTGLLNDGYDRNHLFVVDRNPDKCTMLITRFGVQATGELEPYLSKADIVILAIKPQDASALSQVIGDPIKQKRPLVISLMSGIDLYTLAIWFGEQTPLVRAMPNTPVFIQAGATGLFANQALSKAQKSQVEHIFRAVGVIAWLEREQDINTIIALSGSSPAYFFYILNIMTEVAQNMGLPSTTARLFATQAAFGAAKLALETNESLEQLRRQVTSKGGTTQAALDVFDKRHLSELVEQAMTAAIKRAEELGKIFGAPKAVSKEHHDKQ